MNIYKYLRKSEELYDKNVLAAKRHEEEISPNIVFEVDEKKRTKTYAILHEPHSEFNNHYVRYILLIYSNPSWNIFLLSVMFVVFFMDTSLYTFYKDDERPFEVILIVISLNFVFTFNVMISLGLKFIKKWAKTLNLMEPDTLRIIVDVILALPYSFLYLATLPKLSIDLYGIVPFMALCRVYRFIEFFVNRSTQAGSNQWTTFLFQYLTFFIVSVHTWTCLWYLFANMSFDLKKVRLSWTISSVNLPSQTILDWYLICAYWSVMCLTTNALGDLYPVTTAERVVAMFAITLGFILTTIVFVGSLTSQFITITTRRSLYVMQLKKIKNHLNLINMDPETTRRIIRYYEDLWYQKSGVFKPTLLRLLPYPLQMEICYDLNAVPLYSSLIFRKLPEAFLRRLSLDMAHQFYLPGDIVYEHNQNKTIMVCITNGVLELLSDEDDESPMISFGKGTCFGEVALVLNIPARCTVKAATYVECQVLEKTAFIRLMLTYPNIVSEIREEMNMRIQRSKLRKQKLGSTEPIVLNIYASKERKKSSIKLLKEKLRYIQGKTDEDLTKNDTIDEHCLDLYILNEHVKKRTKKFTCVHGKFPWILEHNCVVVKCWEILMLILVLYICIVYPYFIGFKRYFPGGLFFYAEIVTNITLLLNLVMNFVTAVKTKKKYIRSFWEIVDYKMNTLGFYLDLIALIPFEHLATIHTVTVYQDKYREHLFYMCKGFKLCLVWRISSFFQKLEKNLLFNTIVVKVSKYCLYLSLLSYWCGVILYTESCFVSRCHSNSWFAIGQVQDQISGVAVSKTAYPIITSIYFATTVLFAVGYGDFSPGDRFDMGFVAFLSLYGVLLAGYCVAEFSSVVTHWSRAKTAFLEVILTIDKFMKENNMHPSIKARIMAFYELQWQYNAGVDLTEQSWLKDTIIPSELRKKVLHQARFKTLTSIVFFQVKNKSFIHTLTEMARDVILPPGEILFYGGTISRELYIIESGYCLVTSRIHRDTKSERILGPGRSLGLLVLLYGIPAVNTIITLTHCKFITINHYAYTSALSLFPEMKEHEHLLTRDELMSASNDLKETKTQKEYLQRSSKRRYKITSILENVINSSFINVKEHYNKQQQSYLKSYKQFHILNNIAPYLLLPIVIKPDGIFLKIWATLRLITAIALCLLLPIMVALAPLNYNNTIIIFVLESICYVDIYLMFHVAYYGSKNQLIYHPYLTAKNYLKVLLYIFFLNITLTVESPSFIGAGATWTFDMVFVLSMFILSPTRCETLLRSSSILQKSCISHWFSAMSSIVSESKRAFTIDLLTTFPWYAICLLYNQKRDPHQDMFQCVLRLINVLQIYRLYAAFWTQSIQDLKRVYLMSVLYFLLLTLFFLNLYTSILITMSCTFVKATDPEDFQLKLARVHLKRPFIKADFHRDGNMICSLGSWIGGAHFEIGQYLKPAKVYLLACYWSATSFSGAGFGDITAHDTTDMLLSICNIVHGVLFFGYVYAKIASLKALADQVLTKFQENLKHLELFLSRERIPFSLKKSVVDYWKYQWKRTGGWSHQAILGKLHTNLNEDAVLYMYEKTLREIPLFENVQNSFFRAFAKQLTEQYFQKGYVIMRSNEVIDQLYIIYRGKVDIISDINEVEACIGPGGIFGNIKGATQYLTESNIVASRNIDLLSIKGAEFYTLLKSYPSVLRKVKQSVDLAPKDYVLPTTNSERTSLEIQEATPDYQEAYEDDDYDFFDLVSEGAASRSLGESCGSRSQMDVRNTNLLPALMMCVKPHKWFRASITPDCLWVIFMDRFMLCVAYVDFLMLVYEMAFMSIDHYLWICVVFDAIFLYKIFLDFHTGYMNRYGDYVLNPRKVRKKYFSNVLLRRRDFIANIPLCYLAFALPLKLDMALCLFTVMRTPQLFRITYVFTFKLHRTIGSSNLLIKLSSIAIWASLLTHVNACVFFKLSCLTPVQCKSSNWMTKDTLNLRADYAMGNYFSIYIAALWYMINLLTITGTGDVSSQNDLEIIETTIITILTKFCTGLLISEMSALITAHMSSRISYDYAINELRDGLRDMDLSCHQMTKMWDYVRELWNRQQGKQMPELIYNLPFRLRCQVMQAVYGGHINESAIFKRTARDFRRMLAMWMRHCVFFPGNYIVQCGDSDQCIYFIHRGEVEVLTVHPNLTESIYDILGPEDSFGVAQGLFVGVPHHFSFRARTVVDIVYLKLDQWKYLLDFYPKSASIIHRKVENVYRAT